MELKETKGRTICSMDESRNNAYENWKDFGFNHIGLSQDTDIPFSYDIQKDENGSYFITFHFVDARSVNMFYHIRVNNITEADMDNIQSYLVMYKTKIMDIWKDVPNIIKPCDSSVIKNDIVITRKINGVEERIPLTQDETVFIWKELDERNDIEDGIHSVNEYTGLELDYDQLNEEQRELMKKISSHITDSLMEDAGVVEQASVDYFRKELANLFPGVVID